MFKPNREFQAGLDHKEARRARERNALSLRRKERENKLQKKRKKLLNRANNTQSHSQSQKIQIQKELQLLPQFVKGCFTEHKAAIFECTQKIRKLLSHSENVPIQEVINTGVVPRLIQFLNYRSYPELQFEALWVLTNITSSIPEYTAHVVRNGAVPLFINLLNSPNYSLKEQSIWALGNMAGDGLGIRNLLLDNDILSNLSTLCQLTFDPNYSLKKFGEDPHNPHSHSTCSAKHQFLSLISNLAWAVSNFCREPYQNTHKKYEKKLLECLYHLLHQKIGFDADNESLKANDPNSYGSSIGWSFSYLFKDLDESRDTIPMLDIMNESGMTKELIALLTAKNAHTKHSVLRAVGNLVTSNDKYTNKCIEYGILPQLYEAMTYHMQHQSSMNAKLYFLKLKELCWVVSNVTAGTNNQIVQVIKAGLFPMLIQTLCDSRMGVAQEALWAVSNATTSPDREVIEYLVKENIIPSLCKFFKRRFSAETYTKQNEKILSVSLECVQNILSMDSETHSYAIQFETEGGCDFIEEIQSFENASEGVYSSAVEIVKLLNDGTILDNGDGFVNESNNGNINNISATANGSQFGFGLGNTNNTANATSNQTISNQSQNNNNFTFNF